MTQCYTLTSQSKQVQQIGNDDNLGLIENVSAI